MVIKRYTFLSHKQLVSTDYGGYIIDISTRGNQSMCPVGKAEYNKHIYHINTI